MTRRFGSTGSGRFADTHETGGALSRYGIALVLAALAFALYLALGLRLGRGAFFSVDNLAFDLDANLYFKTLFDDEKFFALRHPFLDVWRGGGRTIMYLGVPEPAAYSVVFAAVGAATLAVIYLALAEFGVALAERVLLAAFFAVSGAQLFNALVIDTYGFSGLGLAVLYLVFLRREALPERHPVLRIVVAVYLFGVTMTNVIQSAIAEAILWMGRLPLVAFLRTLTIFAVILGIAIVAGILLWVPHELLSIDGLKLYYWNSIAKGEEFASFKTILVTFLGYGFIVPEFTAVPLPNGEPTMLDFRDFRMAPAGFAALVLWGVMLVMGAVASLGERRHARFAFFLVVTILLNLFIHTRVQYRMSVFLYAAHLQAAIFLLAAFAIRASSQMRGAGRIVPAIALLLLVILTGYNNLGRAIEFAAAFG